MSLFYLFTRLYILTSTTSTTSTIYIITLFYHIFNHFSVDASKILASTECLLQLEMETFIY